MSIFHGFQKFAVPEPRIDEEEAPMMAQNSSPARTLLLFGPGIMTLDERYFNRILTAGKDGVVVRSALEAIEDLQSCWTSLCRSIPKLGSSAGLEQTQSLSRWLKDGALPTGTMIAATANSILGPLVIIAQLVEYLRYSESLSDSDDEDGAHALKHIASETETVGCCLGVFSALIVSSSRSRPQLHHNIGAVIRIVFILGALSDAQDAVDTAGPSASLIAFWRGGRTASSLREALSSFPKTYISVLYDDNRATLTTPRSSADAVKSHLAGLGITASDTEFHGRFHAGGVYDDDLQQLYAYAQTHPTFQFPDSSDLLLPSRVNSVNLLENGIELLKVASGAFLTNQFDWISTFRAAAARALRDRATSVLEFGPERCVPPTLLRRLSSQVTHYNFEEFDTQRDQVVVSKEIRPSSGNDIAIIGMASNVSGAEDLQEFWDIILAGKSQHTELVPNSRFGMETSFRQPRAEDTRKWYGNLIKDFDVFDQRFFKRPPREVLHMDPQQRLMLQAAYQAVAQSGYYQNSTLDKNIGCFLGMVGTDYEHNISHTDPNAFSATGALRSYIAGKVSHYFGWTGPGMTIDTACSASTVAIHQACKAILSGDCSAALAGGTNMCSAPMFFQNLSAGSFLSHTGQCKPFDIKADGYCRGEGIGAVFLRKLDDAIAGGDQILGVIKATAINQNHNSTPIFVPNPPSLKSLFETVIERSGIEKKQISFVEAHGTGTPVGDPAEYGSIRDVLGGFARTGQAPLQLGSLKGTVGHCEGASGVLALIKILMMMHHSAIPPQASFDEISPAIKALPSDNMQITKTVLPWTDERKVVLINNYGAAGSNASMVIEQPLRSSLANREEVVLSSRKLPIYISGLDDKAIQAYGSRLRQYIQKCSNSPEPIHLSDLAFNINRQSNWALNRALIFDAESIEDVGQKLLSPVTIQAPAPRPLILCFGGQVSKFVGLDREIYDGALVLRHHLNRCDEACKAIGADSIYPGIFQSEPISDPSILQPLLFSIQYASAMSWIDCGVTPTAIVGHSFGELTGLCVSGILGLEDALTLIHGRSKIIKDSWGSEKGAMMAVEADLVEVNNILLASTPHLAQNQTQDKPSIACHNGPRSFTLAGSSGAIDAVQNMIIDRDASLPVIKYKRLEVTNAFHSVLVDHLKDDLTRLGRKLRFQPVRIPIEHATEDESTGQLASSYVAEHMREPVYFNHAVHRLNARYPEAVWLEAGSNSTITTMANKALGLPKSSVFQAVNLTSGEVLQQLTSTTVKLWQAGVRVAFWPHSRLQTYEYQNIILPPYQFEKQRHWLDFKEPVQNISGTETVDTDTKKRSRGQSPDSLYTLLDVNGSDDSKRIFSINRNSPKFAQVLSENIIGKTAKSCPTTFLIELAVEAIKSVKSVSHGNVAIHPQIHNVKVHAPLLEHTSGQLSLEVHSLGASNTWQFKFASQDHIRGEVLHSEGHAVFQPYDDARANNEFARFERLLTHSRCLEVLGSKNDDNDVIQGKAIYKVFADTIDHRGSRYRGLEKIVGRNNESAGKIVKRRGNGLLLNAALSEVFLQVGSIWTNCMASNDERAAPDAIYVLESCEQWTKSPDLLRRLSQSAHDLDDDREYHLLAQHKHIEHDDSFISDVFVFDSISGQLLEVILGLHYVLTPLKHHLTNADSQKSTSSLNEVSSKDFQYLRPLSTFVEDAIQKPTFITPDLPGQQFSTTADVPKRKKVTVNQLWPRLQSVLADVSGLEPEEIKQTDSMAAIGIDSLLAIELASQVETTFDVSFETPQLLIIEDIPGILSLIQECLGEQDEDTSTEPLGSTPSESTSGVSAPSSVTEDLEHIDVDLKTNLEATVSLPPSMVLEAFREVNKSTDRLLKSFGCAGYLDGLSQKQTRLCLRLVTTAFKELGCDLEAAEPGQILDDITFAPKHQRFYDHLRAMLEETRIINIDDGVMTRTAISLPKQSAQEILEDLMRRHKNDAPSHQLTYNIGSRMAEILSGKADGAQLLFGDFVNRDLMAKFYGELPFNKMCFEQLGDFLTTLVAKARLASRTNSVLKILEMGAGTGGTTKVLLPILTNLGINFEYTFTDLSPSLVAQAKRKYAKYPNMQFSVHDIEEAPSDPNLFNSQHIVIASNAVHATHSLKTSTSNIRKFLRDDGVLMMVEMHEPLFWIDVVWGTLEGWWLFNDDRKHAIVNEQRWQKDLLEAGYKHVEWTSGTTAESRLQRVLIAFAGDIDPALQLSGAKDLHNDGHHISDEANRIRKVAADEYVAKFVPSFRVLQTPNYAGKASADLDTNSTNILVTGTTGSLGSHILAHLLSLPSVDNVYCLNRSKAIVVGPKTKKGANTLEHDPLRRQLDAFESRSIVLEASMLAKLKVIETDSSKPQLGLEPPQYRDLCQNITHLIHNAYPVNGMRTLQQNEPQFDIIRNLIDFAAEVSAFRRSEVSGDFKFTFQFVSSLSAVGKYPMRHGGKTYVPEEQFDIDSALPNGYAESKVVCERILSDTLCRHPDRFQAMTVRLGQLSGSMKTGYWNSMEVLAFLFKSVQTLRSLPAMPGFETWLPIESAASALADLLLLNEPRCHPIYHLDNPTPRNWKDITGVLAETLDVPEKGIVPLEEWLRRIQMYPGDDPWDNPAVKAYDFFSVKFRHMSCGGVSMRTEKAQAHSATLRAVQPVGDELIRKFMETWQAGGFLRS